VTRGEWGFGVEAAYFDDGVVWCGVYVGDGFEVEVDVVCD